MEDNILDQELEERKGTLGAFFFAGAKIVFLIIVMQLVLLFLVGITSGIKFINIYGVFLFGGIYLIAVKSAKLTIDGIKELTLGKFIFLVLGCWFIGQLFFHTVYRKVALNLELNLEEQFFSILNIAIFATLFSITRFLKLKNESQRWILPLIILYVIGYYFFKGNFSL